MKIEDYSNIKIQSALLKNNKLCLENAKNEWAAYLATTNIPEWDLIDKSNQWQERYAFIKLLSRQSGKTHFVVNEAILSNGLMVTHNSATASYIAKKYNYKNVMAMNYQLHPIRGIKHENIRLFIDEFLLCDKGLLKLLLNNNWKSVLMIS